MNHPIPQVIHLTATRIAIMGCAYGNVPALAACLEDARRNGCKATLFAGDAIGFCGHSDEVLTVVRERFAAAIAGNHEREAVAGSSACGRGFADAGDEQASCASVSASLDSLSPRHLRWLEVLPETMVLDTPRGRVLLCHGSPRRINEFLHESTLDESLLLGWLERERATALVCTHTGLPWTRHLGIGRLAANCGSCGKPDDDGDPAVHYLILDLADGQQPLRVQRVEYAHAEWAQRLEREGIDPLFTGMLRTGRWSYGRASLPPAERWRAVRLERAVHA